MPRKIDSHPTLFHIDAIIRRIGTAWAAATADQRARGATWYPTAHALACEAPTVATGAGIIAAVSPQVAWPTNVRDFRTILADGADAHIANTGANLDKALAILRGAAPLDVLGGPKTRAFFQCIADPADRETVCIDRHSARVSFGHDLDSGTAAQYLGWAGAYELAAAGHRAVAEREGELPSTVQAVTWLWYRETVLGLSPQDLESLHVT